MFRVWGVGFGDSLPPTHLDNNPGLRKCCMPLWRVKVSPKPKGNATLRPETGHHVHVTLALSLVERKGGNCGTLAANAKNSEGD